MRGIFDEDIHVKSMEPLTGNCVDRNEMMPHCNLLFISLIFPI